MPPARRRIRSSPPLTQTCRFADGGRRCRRIATQQDFCAEHAAVMLAAVAPTFGDQILGTVDRLIANRLRPYLGRQDAEAMAGVFTGAIGAAARRATAPRPAGDLRQQPPPGAAPRPRQPPPPPPPPPPDPAAQAREALGFDPGFPLTRQIIKERQRELARVYHPDRGPGSEQRMRAVNAAAEVLLRQVTA